MHDGIITAHDSHTLTELNFVACNILLTASHPHHQMMESSLTASHPHHHMMASSLQTHNSDIANDEILHDESGFELFPSDPDDGLPISGRY